MNVLSTHLALLERSLIAQAKVVRHAGHSIHKGTPREAFLSQFLACHLPERAAIGTGEIIDSDSLPGERRPQVDIVISSRDYPRLNLGGGIDSFLTESVIATIEVKSTLTKPGLSSAFRSAKIVKELKDCPQQRVRMFNARPRPSCFVVAYVGPASMTTVYGWIREIEVDLGISRVPLPLSPNERYDTPSGAIDAILVLGKGFLYFDNIPLGFASMEARKPDRRWIGANVGDGSLMFLFTMLTMACAGWQMMGIDLQPYLATFKFRENQIFEGD